MFVMGFMALLAETFMSLQREHIYI